jgi:anti-sigma regulatory factor (Ser/Thr protein kinase)
VDLGHLDVPSGPEAAKRARAALERWIGSTIATTKLQDAQLLVSELVANCVQHAAIGEGSPISISAGRTDALVWCEVADDGHDGTAARRQAQPRNGMGLNMVAGAAIRWGSSQVDGTKVWFELAL